jgi:3-oxoacyl-[acyl-carrier protein] reductase
MSQRIALVTGAARGIGKAIAERLAAMGHHVIVADLNLEAAQQTAQAIGGSAGCLDVSSYLETEAFMAQAYAQHGRLDILVNNAGIIRRGNLLSVSEDDWDKVIAVNLKGAFNCAKHAAPYMIKGGWGRIVNIVSIAAKTGDISEETRRRVLSGIPLGRLGKPQEVAAAVAFLVSEEAGFITGATLDINGGALMD